MWKMASEDLEELGASPSLLVILIAAALFYFLLLNSTSETKKEKLPSSTQLPLKEFMVDVSHLGVCKRTGRPNYKIDFYYKGVRWSVHKRYSEFRKLIKAHPLPKESTTKFPPKARLASFMGSDSNLHFLEERRGALNSVLKKVLPNAKAFQVAALGPQAEFFEIPKNLIDTSKFQIAPDRKYIVEEACKAVRMASSHLAKAVGEGQGEWKRRTVTKDNASVYFFEEGDKVHVAMSGTVEANYISTLDFVTDAKLRKGWDDLFKFENKIEKLEFSSAEKLLVADAGYELVRGSIQHSGIASPMKALVAERDSVSVGVVARRISDGAYLLAYRSITDNRSPPPNLDGSIRVEVVCMGFLFENLENGKRTGFSSISMVDPKAYVPPWIIKTMAPQRAGILKEIGPMATKRSLTEPSSLP